MYSSAAKKHDEPSIIEIKRSQIAYDSTKPIWWKRVAGRRGSKSQRKSIANMTEAGYVLPTKIGRFHYELSMEKVFASPSGTSLTCNDIMIPKSFTNLPRESPSILLDTAVNLELGFGLGDNLLTLAMKFPDEYFLGAEIHSPGVGTTLGRMEDAIMNDTYWNHQNWFDHLDAECKYENILSKTKKKPYDNLRIFPGDGVKLLSYLADHCINAIYLTFPDPFPKENDEQYRVIQEETIRTMERVLKTGGCFYLATDAPSFDEWTVKVFTAVMKQNSKWHVVDPCPDRRSWLPVVSKYEEKGLLEGRCTMCRCWKHIHINDVNA